MANRHQEAYCNKHVSAGEEFDELLDLRWIDDVHRKSDENRTMKHVGPRRSYQRARSYIPDYMAPLYHYPYHD